MIFWKYQTKDIRISCRMHKEIFQFGEQVFACFRMVEFQEDIISNRILINGKKKV